MYPHDPSGSAFNIVNCRCYVEFLYVGDTRPDGTVITESETPEEIVPVEEEVLAELPTPTEMIGRFEAISADNIDDVVTRLVGDPPVKKNNKYYKSDVKRHEVRREAMKERIESASRAVSFEDVLILDNSGLDSEAFKIVVDTFDSVVTTNSQMGRSMIVDIVEEITGQAANAVGDCTIALSRQDTQQIRLKASHMRSRVLQNSKGFNSAGGDGVQGRIYTIVHEWGHATDPTRAFASNTTAGVAERDRLQALSDSLFDKYKNTQLSGYGSTNAFEGYAEAFSDFWFTKGKSTNVATRAYAKAFGWRI